MDHRDLLRRYIAHVADCEGATFLEDLHINTSRSAVRFTEEEIEELRLLDAAGSSD